MLVLTAKIKCHTRLQITYFNWVLDIYYKCTCIKLIRYLTKNHIFKILWFLNHLGPIIYSTSFTHLLKSVAVVCILVILLTLICETLTDILWQLLERWHQPQCHRCCPPSWRAHRPSSSCWQLLQPLSLPHLSS